MIYIVREDSQNHSNEGYGYKTVGVFEVHPISAGKLEDDFEQYREMLWATQANHISYSATEFVKYIMNERGFANLNFMETTI